MSMIGIRKHLIRTSLILRSGGLFLTPTRSLTCSIIRSLVIVTIRGPGPGMVSPSSDRQSPCRVVRKAVVLLFQARDGEAQGGVDRQRVRWPDAKFEVTIVMSFKWQAAASSKFPLHALVSGKPYPYM